MEHFNKLVFKDKIYTRGEYASLKFPNGYGASVMTKGYGRAPYELAVVGKDNQLDYSTSITDDVIGRQTAEDIDVLLKRIEELSNE
jgi:hypothetical protein|tara:strand:- start:5641 stop:5898 length:258 start_codon:yes stop_codon:yes gene_type:complete